MLYEKLLVGVLVLILLAGGLVGWIVLEKKPKKTVKPEQVAAPSKVRLDTLDISTDPEELRDASDEAIAFQNKSHEYDGFAEENTEMNSIEKKVDKGMMFSNATIGMEPDSGLMNFPGTEGFGNDEIARLEIDRKLGNSLASRDSQNIDSLSNQNSIAHDYENWLPDPELCKQHNLSIESAKLVSFSRFGAPRVYRGEKLPTFKQLAEISVTTRNVSAREMSAITQLKRNKQNGKDIVVDDTQSPTVVLTAIRSAQQCSQCHSGSAGEMLGAFTYDMTP